MIANQNKSGEPSRVMTLSKTVLLVLLVFIFSGAAARASNVLANPGMESGLSSWTCYGRTGQEGWYSYALATVPDPVVSGNNSFKVYAGWNGDPNWNGTYQDAACLPTSVFTATGWFRTKSTDRIVGTYGAGAAADNGNTAWLEVTFRDAGNNVLALYKSAVFDGSWTPDTWFEMPITNQCDLVTGLPTGSVTTLVAPVGTVKARYQVVLKQSAWAGAGALWVDDMVLNQVSGPTAPEIGSVSPGAILLANAADGISFTVASASSTPINNSDIHATLNGTDISSSLNISGSDTSKSVTYQGLQTNKTYNVSLQVTDTLGLSVSQTFTFDTWSPLFLWEGEDYDFGSGQHIDNPVLSSSAQSGSYFGQVGVNGVDYNDTSHDGDKLYRASDLMATTIAGDLARKKFVDAQTGDPLINDYKIGWFYTAEWVNYTRNFPSGTYNVYARFAGGAGAASATLGKVTDGVGTAVQTVTNLGTFSFVGTGWTTYQYVPLRDANGNLVPLTLNGVNTLRLTTGGGADVNFLMLVAADTNNPVISNVYPDGSLLQQFTNTFHFSINSPTAAINDSSIGLVLNGVDVSSKLKMTGTANSKDVVFTGLRPNVANYTATISVTNANGMTASDTVRFDTFRTTLYQWEAEDYDFGGGQYYDNPPIDAYFGLPGTAEVDFHELYVNTPQVAYRTADPMGTDYTGDVPRAKYAGTNDYNIGWFTVGEWVNYTRHYPAGNYYVYGRFARGTGTNAAPLLSKVTDGAGTPNQTTATIGSFSVDSHGWGTYAWVILKDGSGNPVQLALDGSATTFRVTSAGPETNTEVNVNFLMLLPIPNPVSMNAGLSGANIILSFPTETGFQFQVQYQDSLGSGGWTDLGNAVVGDGTVQSVSDPIQGGSRFYRLLIQ